MLCGAPEGLNADWGVGVREYRNYQELHKTEKPLQTENIRKPVCVVHLHL